MDRQITRQRHNNETFEFAVNRYKKWDSEDIIFLKENAKTKTAREIAISLGRTYEGIIMKSFKEHISLMTNDKQHGILITR